METEVVNATEAIGMAEKILYEEIEKMTEKTDTPCYSQLPHSLELYFREMSEISLLTPEEEIALTVRIAELRQMPGGENSSEYAKCFEKMVTANLRLVIKYAWRYYVLVKGQMEVNDLVQEGNIGLIKAVEKFDPEKGNRFSTYAVWWIRQAILRVIANQAGIIRLPIHIQETIRKIERAIKQLEKQGKTTTLQDIKEEIGGYSEERLEKAMKGLVIKDEILSLQILLSTGEGETGNELGDMLESPIEPPDEKAIENDRKEKLRAFLGCLSERESKVLILRYGLEDDCAKTLEEVGNIFGITRERVRQIQAAAIFKLRHPARASKARALMAE